MNKDFIRDEFIFEASSFKEVEGKRKGVLRTIQGPLAEWDNLNRNGRKYSERLWDKVLNSDYVKEQMEFKTLYGEANHPQGRFEVDFARVSHSIVEMHKVPGSKQIVGTIDILDTPLGRVIDALYEYGSTVGFSSRAGGSLHKKKDYIEVDEDTYHFITFDAVPYPSVKAARLVSEGADYVEDNTKIELSDEAHKKLYEIIESSSQKDKEILKSFIYNLRYYDLDKELKILEGLDNSIEQSSADTLKDTTLCLLKESYLISSKLKVENEELLRRAEIAESTLSRVSKEKHDLSESVTSLNKTVVDLANEKGQLIQENTKLGNENTELKNTISLHDGKSLDAEMLAYEKAELEKQVKALKTVVEGITLENKALVLENKNLHDSAKSIITESVNEQLADYNETVTELGKAVSELATLKESYNATVTELTQVKSSKTKTDSEYKALSKELTKLDEQVRTQNKLIGELTDKVKLLEGTNATLQANMASEVEKRDKTYQTELDSVVESYEGKIKTMATTYESKINAYKKEMLSSVCGNYGIDESVVRAKLGKADFTLGDVHLVCEEISSSTSIAMIGQIEEEVNTPSEKKVVDNPVKARLDSVFEGVTINRRGKI